MAKKKGSDTRFDPPIDMDLRNNPGPVQFATLSDFETWITEEINFWQKITSVLNIPKLPRVMKDLVEINLRRRGENMQYSPDSDGIYTLLSRYADGKLIHRDSMAGRLVDQFVATGAMEQAANLIIVGTKGEISITRAAGGDFDIGPLIYAAAEIAADRGPATVDWERQMNMRKNMIDKMIMETQTTDNTLKQRLEATNALERRIDSLGEELDRKVGEALAPHLGRIDTTLKDADSAIEQANLSFGAAMDVLDTRLKKAMDNAQDEAKNRIRAIDEAYGERIDIKAVAELWGDKRKRHGWLTIVFGVAFAAGLAAVVVVVVFWGANILETIGLMGGNAPADEPADEPTKFPLLGWSTGGLILAAAAGLSVYTLLRQLGRLFLTNLAQHSDADERIAMIDAFLSLEKESKLTATEDRILILQALFRPGPGAGAGPSDEGMPPHWFDVLMRRLDPGRGSRDGSG